MRLSQVRPYEAPGIDRVRRGTSFDYRDSSGARVADSVRKRLDALAIPPAWTDVWIAPSRSAHILAVGVDEAGRRQYIYHPAWREAQDEAKFERALDLAEALPRARRRASRDFAEPPLSHARVLATAFRILDVTAMRIGGEEYATVYGSRGLCTLLRRHATVDGPRVGFAFRAKSKQLASITVRDADLATAVGELVDGRAPASRLLAWADGRRRRPLHTSDVNTYVRLCAGEQFSAKDFRTLHATAIAAATLPAVTPESEREIQAAIRSSVEAAAGMLGNTTTVAKASYIHPLVFEKFLEGQTVGGSKSMTALLALLRD